MHGLSLDHVALAVASLADAIPVFELLTGAPSSPVEELASQGVRLTFVGKLELLEPLGPGTTVARFLERRGPGLHHVAFQTPDVVVELERLRSEGFTPLDPRPRMGARGHRVAFLHPGGTGHVLVELVEVSDS